MVSSSTAKKSLAAVALIVGTVAILFGAILLFNQKTPDARTLFLSGIRSTLTQKSLTCTISESNPSTQSTTVQIINLDLDRRLAGAVLSVKQPGSSVTTEELQTPKGSFIRYKELETSQVNGSKKKPDTSKVLNVWSRTELDPGQSTLYAKTVLGQCIMPLAHLGQKQADEIMREVEKGKIFRTNMKDTRIVKLNGALTREYKVTTMAEPYIIWMKQVQTYIGLNDLDKIENASYNKNPPAKLEFYVNQSTGRLTQVIITASKRGIVLSNQGKAFEFETPKDVISADEMQERLKSL